jgi:hypothetical protein
MRMKLEARHMWWKHRIWLATCLIKRVVKTYRQQTQIDFCSQVTQFEEIRRIEKPTTVSFTDEASNVKIQGL